MAGKIRSEYLQAYFGSIIEHGFTAVPNLLIDYAPELGIRDQLVIFIIRILRATQRAREHRKFYIDDAFLNTTYSRRSLARFRKELSEITDGKGRKLIIIDTAYVKNHDTGEIKGKGTIYDFSALFDHIYETYGVPICQNGTSDRSPKKQMGTPESQNGTMALGKTDTKRSGNDKMAHTIIDKEIDITDIFNGFYNHFKDQSGVHDTITGIRNYISTIAIEGETIQIGVISPPDREYIRRVLSKFLFENSLFDLYTLEFER